MVSISLMKCLICSCMLSTFSTKVSITLSLNSLSDKSFNIFIIYLSGSVDYFVSWQFHLFFLFLLYVPYNFFVVETWISYVLETEVNEKGHASFFSKPSV